MKQGEKVAVGDFQFVKLFVPVYEGEIERVAPDGSLFFKDGVFVSASAFKLCVPIVEAPEKKEKE